VIGFNARQYHHRNRGQRGILTLLATERPPIHHRHAKVQEDDARVAAAAQIRQRLLAVSGLSGGESLEPEELRHQPRQISIVVDD